MSTKWLQMDPHRRSKDVLEVVLPWGEREFSGGINFWCALRPRAPPRARWGIYDANILYMRAYVAAGLRRTRFKS